MGEKRRITEVKAELENLDEIELELDNGVGIILSLKSKYGDPKFAEIKELSLPKTDGERVYWSNGAVLTADEIITMLRSENKE